MSLEDVQLKHSVPSTVSPDDYFNYYCKDPKAIAMFYKYVGMVMDGEVESYEQAVDELLIRIRDLEEELKQLENELGENK